MTARLKLWLGENSLFPWMKRVFLLFITIIPMVAFAQEIEITPEGHEIMSVFFAGGSYYLDQNQKVSLQDWLKGKLNLHEYEILLQSHTDNIGSVTYNQYLSQMRSESVLQALEEIMISRDDVRTQDFGELAPQFDNNQLQGRLNNRRVDIILVPPSS
jgi:outer membrane protein OmpA-like peptidoglycan-associated protein